MKLYNVSTLLDAFTVTFIVVSEPSTVYSVVVAPDVVPNIIPLYVKVNESVITYESCVK
jgi:hypothetical protein